MVREAWYEYVDDVVASWYSWSNHGRTVVSLPWSNHGSVNRDKCDGKPREAMCCNVEAIFTRRPSLRQYRRISLQDRVSIANTSCMSSVPMPDSQFKHCSTILEPWKPWLNHGNHGWTIVRQRYGYRDRTIIWRSVLSRFLRLKRKNVTTLEDHGSTVFVHWYSGLPEVTHSHNNTRSVQWRLLSR